MKQGSITLKKFLMIFFSFVFLVYGIALIIIGVNGGCNGCDLTEFLGLKHVISSRIIIVMGTVIIVFAFSGCCGVIRKEYCVFMMWSGIMLIILGFSGINVECNGCDLTKFLGSKQATASRIINIVMGLVIIVIAFLSCCGAIRENKSILITSGKLLLIVFLVQAAGGARAYSYRDQLEVFLKENKNDSIAQQNVGYKEILEEMQQRLECCGVSGHDNSLNITISASFNQNKTCDGKQYFTADKSYKPNCHKVLINKMKDNMTMVVSAAVSIAIIKFLGWMFMYDVFLAIKIKEYNLIYGLDLEII